jgi:hypothetical protein
MKPPAGHRVNQLLDVTRMRVWLSGAENGPLASPLVVRSGFQCSTESCVDIDATLEQVWTVLTDIERWPERMWTSRVSWADRQPRWNRPVSRSVGKGSASAEPVSG